MIYTLIRPFTPATDDGGIVGNLAHDFLLPIATTHCGPDPFRVLSLSLPCPRVYPLQTRTSRSPGGSPIGSHGDVLAGGHCGP